MIAICWRISINYFAPIGLRPQVLLPTAPERGQRKLIGEGYRRLQGRDGMKFGEKKSLEVWRKIEKLPKCLLFFTPVYTATR